MYAYVRLDTQADTQPGRLRLPGLDPARTYEVVRRADAGTGSGTVTHNAPWWDRGRAVASGAVLATVGLPAPMLNPAQAVLLHLRPLD